MNTITATFLPVVLPAGLYDQRPGETAPQPCFLQLDLEDGELWAASDAETGGGIPAGVFHRRSLRWTIPRLTADAANELMRAALPLTQRILNDCSIDWDGNNMTGALGPDAAAAVDELQSLCDPGMFDTRELVTAYDAADWFEVNGRASGIGDVVQQYGLSAASTDADLDDIAYQVAADAVAEGEGHCVIHGAREWLQDARDELRDVLRADLEQVAQEITAAKIRRDNLIVTAAVAGDSSRDIGARTDMSHTQVQRVVARMGAWWCPGRIDVGGAVADVPAGAGEAEADKVLAGLGYERISPWTPADPDLPGVCFCRVTRKV